MEFINLQHVCMGCMSHLENPTLPCPKCNYKQGTANSVGQLSPGTILNESAGKYVIGRALGQGGFGITYIAGDIKNNVKVAIKEFYPKNIVTRAHDGKTVLLQSNTPENNQSFQKWMERFYSEANVLAKFDDDPHIVNVKAIFKANDTAYIVMEFVEGETFKKYLEKLNKPMKLSKVVNLFLPLFVSLEKVHEKKLLHRDISPDNIIILDGGKSIKLIDFGAARNFSMEGENSLTVTFKMGYAPPEQFQSHGEQGAWTDVYALAATIYRAVTGIKPASTIDRWNGADTLVLPSKIEGIKITAAQEQVLLKGMALNYKERYPSIKSFYNALYATFKPAVNQQPDKSKQSNKNSNDTTDKKDFSQKCLLVALLVVAIIGGIITSHSSSTSLAITDLSLNSISVGMTANKVNNALGKSTQSHADIFPGYVIDEYPNMYVYMKNSTVCGLYSENANIKTKRGIHPGSAENEIQKAYGAPVETRELDDKTKAYIYKLNADNTTWFLSFIVTGGKVKYVEVENKTLAELVGAVQFLNYFHERITAHEFKAAYDCFSDNMKKQFSDYNKWAAGYKTTAKSEITKLNSVDQNNSRITLTYILRAVDKPGGERFFNGKITFIKVGDYWRIDNIENKAN